MKKVHMGGYSIVIPEGYVHSVKVSRIKGSHDVRFDVSKRERATSAPDAFAQYPCWESEFRFGHYQAGFVLS